MTFDSVPDHTPIIVGSAQHSEPLTTDQPKLSSPMDLAGIAARGALSDAGGRCQASDVDCIAMVRMFSDTAPAWRCPFGGSNNPPGSIAKRLGIRPSKLIYSASAGTQPMELLIELMGDIARGETKMALLAGSEAIGSQRYAQRRNIELDWQEHIDLPMDERRQINTIHSPQELAANLYLPMQVYALIENLRAHQRGLDRQQLDASMGQLLSGLSRVAANNPHAVRQQAYSAEAISSPANNNYELSLPYRKLQVSQDAVNQSAALLITSVGHARKLGIDESKWVSVQAYAYAHDIALTQRQDIGRSSAMQSVLNAVTEQTGNTAKDFQHIDIYSCFPCAVDAACEVLGLPSDGSVDLTVTGGLPYFGGPGNNYCTHSMAEMVQQLRQSRGQGLVTANGGALSKHAAVVLATEPGNFGPDWLDNNLQRNSTSLETANIPAIDYCDQPTAGSIVTYTFIPGKKTCDRVLVIGETDNGQRFLAINEESEVCKWVSQHNPIGRRINITTENDSHRFCFSDQA